MFCLGKKNVIRTVCSSYTCVVLRGRVGFCVIQGYYKQAALNGLQDGLIVWIDVYQMFSCLPESKQRSIDPQKGVGDMRKL